VSSRDIDPPSSGVGVPPRWELWLGHDLEALYQWHTEVPVVGLAALVGQREFPERLGQSRWVRQRLLALGLPEEDVSAYERLAEEVGRPVDVLKRHDDPHTASRRRAAEETLDSLMQRTRQAIPDEGRGCFDVGVMLSRFEMCARMVVTVPALGDLWADVAEDMVPLYLRELHRSTDVLLHFIAVLVQERTLLVSGHDELHHALGEFGVILARARTKDTLDFSDGLFTQLGAVLHAAGLIGAETALKVLARILSDQLDDRLVPSEAPTDVPHNHEDEQRLSIERDRLRSTLTSRPRPGLPAAVAALRDACRRVLGPVHPVTLDVQLDLCLMMGLGNETDRAVMLIFDTSDTALHHLGMTAAANVTVQNKCLALIYGLAGPELAQHFYNARLRWFAEAPAESLPEDLRVLRDGLTPQDGW
jgi:hypothetical protein